MSSPEILRSSVWDAALTRTLARLDQLAGSNQAQRSTAPSLIRETASAVLAHAHARLLAALAADRTNRKAAVSELVDDAVALVGVLPNLWLTHTATGYEERLPAIAAAVERRLSAHEHGVLGGERTYSLSVAEAEEPAVRMRQSLAQLAARESGGLGDLISVQSAAIDLAALLIRGAGNIATHARACEAPEHRTQAVDRALLRVGRAVATPARELDQTPGEDIDAVGRHLRKALRLLGHAKPHLDAGTADRGALDRARVGWLQLAALEHVAVAGLDAALSGSGYRPHSETLNAAITETGANLLCGARLIARAGAFRHEEAWHAQSIALSNAREMYVNTLPPRRTGSNAPRELSWLGSSRRPSRSR